MAEIRRVLFAGAAAAFAVFVLTSVVSCVARADGPHVTWMAGVRAPGTPARYDRVGVIEVGPRSAENVLVLEPGTSAGSAYFVPLARWLVRNAPGWQVWSVERRENLLEDQSVLNLAKRGKASPGRVFDYYLGYLVHPVARHFAPAPDASVGYAKRWGLAVAVGDLHRVIRAARRLGGRVVLGGHSLGGAVVTAYATWNFAGKPGARDLAGLVYDDGASSASPVPASTARQSLDSLNAGTSPWFPFVPGVPPYDAGIFGAAGALAAIEAPNQPSLAEQAGLLPAAIKPPVPVTNLAQFGYGTSVNTSKLVFAIMAHDGQGLAARPMPDGLFGWNGAGALTPIKRYATMLSGTGMLGVDGVEWYFPSRLFLDAVTSGAIDEGNANSAQRILGLRSTMGHRLPRRLLMYAFGAHGGQAILAATRTLARQSHIPARNLVLVNRHGTYAHNDPAGAFPRNAFFAGLVRFLGKVGRG